MKVEIKEVVEDKNSLAGAVANVVLSNDDGKVLFEFFLTRLEYDLIRERDEEYKNAHIEEAIIEDLAALEHEQWTKWSKSLARREHISEERQARWESFWIPYGLLSEETKADDRRWARRALTIVRDADRFNREKAAKKTTDQRD